MRRVALMLAPLFLLACAVASKWNDFMTGQDSRRWFVAEERFYESVATIGLVTLQCVDQQDPCYLVTALYDSLITESLRMAGYAVVPVPEARTVANEENEEHASGAAQDGLIETAIEHTIGRLATAHPDVDAFLEPSLQIADINPHPALREESPVVCVRIWSAATAEKMFHNDGPISAHCLEPACLVGDERPVSVDAVHVALGPMLQRPVPKQ